MNSCFDSPVAKLEMSRYTVDPLIEDIASGGWTPSSAEAKLFLSDKKLVRRHKNLRSLISWFTGSRQPEPGEPVSLVELSTPGNLFPPTSWRFKP